MKGKEFPPEFQTDIFRANPDLERDVADGKVEFEPLDFRIYENGEDQVLMGDWEAREQDRTVHDPSVETLELVRYRTSPIVKRIIIQEAEIDWIKFSLLRGLKSTEAQQSLQDISGVLNRRPEEIYERYLDAMLSKFSDAIAYKNPVRKLEKIPMGATPAW